MVAKLKFIFNLENLKLKKIVLVSLLFSLLGIADTIYLTVAHYSQAVTLACPDTGFINCAKVTSSSYSEIFGIPAAVLGLVFFIILFVIELPIFWGSKYNWVSLPRQIFVSIGLLSVFWFVYVEFHYLHAICLYCTGVHILTFLSFVTILFASEHFRATNN
jgi:uncharacterized membrane protein